MNIIWTKSSKSGLGDRLIDIALVSAMARCAKAQLYFVWEPVMGSVKPWKQVRYEDYKYENFSQYFRLPSNIHVNSLPSEGTTFNAYLGGIYSPITFYQAHVVHITPRVSQEEYLAAFNETMSAFQPTPKLMGLIRSKRHPSLAVHIRREDKIRARIDEGLDSVTADEVNELDRLTIDLLNRMVNPETRLFICADDEGVKQWYMSKYHPYLVPEPEGLSELEQTYYDMYMLSISDTIVLSQKHSSFSLFASLIRGKRLVYLYDDCLLANMWKGLPTIVNRKDV